MSLHARNTATSGAGTEAAKSIGYLTNQSPCYLLRKSERRQVQRAYFADGIQEEILTKLASIADLKVIPRTSTAKYKSKPEDLRTVSQQLGVATVLEGSVQRGREQSSGQCPAH